MKNYKLLLILTILFSSCGKDFLVEDPKANITPTSFYKTSNDLDAAVRGIALSFNLVFNQTAGFATCYGADDITAPGAGNKIPFSEFDTFQANSSNDRMVIWWNNLYNTIKSSNSLILNYENATEATQKQREEAAATAYFYRAISYFFLTRVWGEIPMPLDNSINNERPKSKPAEIYNQIVEDLLKAEVLLPDAWPSPMRQSNVDILPTAGSAKALLADVYLTMAGWPLKQTDKYALAATKAKEVIDNKNKWGYKLLDECSQLWDKNFKFNNETVFGCYYNNKIANIWNYDMSWGNGNQIGPAGSGALEEGGWDEIYGEISFYNSFPEGKRKDATYQTVYYIENNPSKAVPYTELSSKHPFFWKFRDDDNFDKATHKATDWWGSITVPVIRYAGVLLTYAEAKAMSSSPDQTAYAAINEVRKRAGLKDLTPGLSQADFRNAVLAEKGWEFAGPEPTQRWFDLIRTETVAEANAKRHSSEVKLKGNPSDTNHTFYWAPIPFFD